jgi:hypothetical protein
MLKSIAIYQIIGGLIGFFILWTIDFSSLSTNKVVLSIIAILLFTLSIYSGFLLLKNNLAKGINLSIFLNSIQVISFGVLGYVFKFVSGVCIGLNLDLTEDVIVGLLFDVTNFQINSQGSSDALFLGINFIPIIILYFLFKSKDSLN